MDKRASDKLRGELLSAFNEVDKAPFQKYTAGDWTKERPQTFNCSSFAQWIALRCLGWGDSQRQMSDSIHLELSHCGISVSIRRPGRLPARHAPVARIPA